MKPRILQVKSGGRPGAVKHQGHTFIMHSPGTMQWNMRHAFFCKACGTKGSATLSQNANGQRQYRDWKVDNPDFCGDIVAQQVMNS